MNKNIFCSRKGSPKDYSDIDKMINEELSKKKVTIDDETKVLVLIIITVIFLISVVLAFAF